MRVWLWLVYKFTENCPIYWLFSRFIQTKKRYPTSLYKIRILTRKRCPENSPLANSPIKRVRVTVRVSIREFDWREFTGEEFSTLGNYLSYQAKNFLVNLTPKELAPCKISHICRCTFNVKGLLIIFTDAGCCSKLALLHNIVSFYLCPKIFCKLWKVCILSSESNCYPAI